MSNNIYGIVQISYDASGGGGGVLKSSDCLAKSSYNCYSG